MRYKRVGLIGAALSLLLTGCWDRTELNELSITSATAIDRDKDSWVVSYQVIIPASISGTGGIGASGGASYQAPVVVHSVSSQSIREAAALSHLETPRKLYIAHNSVLVIGEKAAREGISAILDIYLRNHETRETISVMITPGSGRTILEQLMSIERIPGQGIQRLVEKEQQNLSFAPNVRLYELTMDVLGESKTAILPEIYIAGTGTSAELEKMKSTWKPSKLKLGRLAVIHEGKMVGWLPQHEALGIAFLKDRVKGTAIPFSCSGNDPDKKEATYLLTGSKTKITPQPDGDTFKIEVEIKTKGVLTETDCPQDLLQPDVIRQMEGVIAKEIERQVLSAWDAAKRFDADVVGLSGKISKTFPKQWSRMKKEKKPEWKTMSLSVKADVKLERIGLSNKAFRKNMEE